MLSGQERCAGCACVKGLAVRHLFQTSSIEESAPIRMEFASIVLLAVSTEHSSIFSNVDAARAQPELRSCMGEAIQTF
jgi:hypothetical protein